MNEIKAYSEIFQISRTDSESGLVVSSRKERDRFVHAIALLKTANSEETDLLQSLEGTDSELWPSSPPLQQVYQQEVDGDPVLLGVGMAGKNHFSTSARLFETDRYVELEIESACLIKQDCPERFLGSTYTVADNIAVSTQQDVAELFNPDRKKLGELVAGNSTRIHVDAGRIVTFFPLEIQSHQATQWKYHLRLERE